LLTMRKSRCELSAREGEKEKRVAVEILARSFAGEYG
jgi:hypothetical protein